MYGSSSTSEKSEKMNAWTVKSEMAAWVIMRHSYSCWSTHSERCLKVMTNFSFIHLIPSRSFSTIGRLSSRIFRPRKPCFSRKVFVSGIKVRASLEFPFAGACLCAPVRLYGCEEVGMRGFGSFFCFASAFSVFLDFVAMGTS